MVIEYFRGSNRTVFKCSFWFIRDVTNEPAGAERYEKLVADLPSGLFTVFHEPAEIARLRPGIQGGE